MSAVTTVDLRAPDLRTRVQASDRYPQLLLVTCLFGMFATTFTATILSVSVKTVAADLGSTAGVIGWVVTAPLLAQAVSMPILGRLGDMRGHRRVYLIGFSAALFFSVCTALAWDAASLITFRTLAQLAGTATVPASFAMLFHAFPPEERVRASAWASGALSGASVTGLAIGGVIIDSIGWRPLFLIQALLSAAALLPAFFVLREDEERAPVRMDKAGAVALAVAAFSLSFGANRAAVWGLHPVVVALVVVCPLAVWALVRIERRAEAPLIPLDLLARRNVRVAGGAGFLVSGSHMGSFLVTPLLLQSLFRYSATATSLITICRTLAISLSAPLASRAGMRLGERRTATLAGVAMAIGAGVLALGSAGQVIVIVVAGMVLSGLAFGHAQPSILAIAGNAVEDEHFGLVTSLQQTAGQIGGVTVMSFMTALVGDTEAAWTFATAFVVAAGLAAGGSVVSARALGARRARRLVAAA